MTMQPIVIDVSSKIPLLLNGVNVEFDTTDENIKRISNLEAFIDEKLKEANVKDYSDQVITPDDVPLVLDNLGVALKVVCDEFFEAGTFDKIYAKDPSSIVVQAILTGAAEKLSDHFENQARKEAETQKEKANSYLVAKKKKNNRK
ncbi:hypothetical protein [Listeria ivanovii]|uniref:hypothetical protein n=1 Tax=Listeria ivanovii TaxID=1638 RepID=UPI001941A37B|nr:hypothetical protein [Listeria ivanovii]MBM5707363.1 hypothetical protein [Listeria ivanovii]